MRKEGKGWIKVPVVVISWKGNGHGGGVEFFLRRGDHTRVDPIDEGQGEASPIN